jgi:hypothetical protein
VADGIRGKSTVIARAEDSRYAFFRGQTELVQEAIPAPSAQPQSGGEKQSGGKPAASPSLEKQLLEGLQEQNKSFQMEQRDNLKKIYQKSPSKGVEAKSAF